MPKLAAGANAFRRLREKQWEVKRLMPDIQEIAEDANGIVDPVGYLGAQYAYQAAMIWQESSQLGLAAILQNMGMPTLQVFRAAVDAVKIDVVGEVTDKVIEAYGSMRNAINSMRDAGDAVNGGEAMGMAAEFGVSQAVDLTTNVPIAGWVIKLLWGVGKFIRNIVQIAKDDSYDKVRAIYPESNFNTQLDNLVLNGVLGDLRTTRDWTRLFGPPRLGEGQGNLDDFWVKNLGLPGTREIFRVPGRSADGKTMDWLGAGWTGFLPGTAVLHQGVRLQGSGATEIGSMLLPSAQNLLFWVWKEVTGKGGKAAPSLYTINTKIVADTWAGYISDFKLWLTETNEISTAAKQGIVTAYDGPAGKKLFGWGSKVEFGGDKEMENYHPVKEAEILRKRQWAMLDTLLCAYVDDSFEALKADADLRARWRQRRKQLLEHPARCSVDLEVVPDSEYRDALRQSRSPAVCAQASLSFAFLPPPKPPDGQGGDAGLGGSGDRGGGGGIGFGTIALVGAAIAAGYYANKKGWI